MATPTELLRLMDADRFHEVLAASPKNFREELFRRANVRAKGGGAFSLKSPNKNRVRAAKLLTKVKNGQGVGDDVLEEVIRNYLYTHRDLLADALDALGVTHDDGLTDEDLDFIADLPTERGQELKSELAQKHDAQDVDLYLRFMNIPGASE